jgi:hypothetical protein
VRILTCNQQLVEQKKKAVAASFVDGIEKGDDIGKDLLSIIGRSIVDAGIPAMLTSDYSQGKHGIRLEVRPTDV